MKTIRRWQATMISASFMSLCLLMLIPASLKFASTWRELYFDMGCFREQNLFAPFGLCSLCIEMIGLIVLWTGYRKKERLAWLIMLIILVLFVFPLTLLPQLLNPHAGYFNWQLWKNAIRVRFWPSIWIAEGDFIFLAMLISLLLPIKSFFWKSSVG